MNESKMLPDIKLLRMFGAKEEKDASGAPTFKVGDIKTVQNIVQTKNGTLKKELGENISSEINNTKEIVDASLDMLSESFSNLKKLEEEFIARSKLSTGRLKDSSEKIGQAFIRIHEKANFTKLEQYVLLLERASAAIESLAKIHDTGKLEKILKALG
jgi:hypothetical protein